MGRNTGPTDRLSRREGINLFLKGARSFSQKEPMTRKPYAPGQHGANSKSKPTTYGVQLREKQRVKRTYGLRERKFVTLFEEATKISKNQKTNRGLEFLKLLETRLDNVVYIMGLAPSRAAARQYVTHRHVKVNGKINSIPSLNLKAGDEIELTKENLKPVAPLFKSPIWVQSEGLKGKVLELPTREMIDEGIREDLIIEFYSR